MTGRASTRRRAAARPVTAPGPRRGVGVGEFVLSDGFWARLQDTNADASLEHCLTWMERLGWLANFDAVAHGVTRGRERPGWAFSDSEVYKLLEAMAWELGRRHDADLAGTYDALVGRIAAAQDDDGYLNTCFGHAGQPPRYSDLERGHELYCTGHLLQAAVARAATHGPDPLVDLARRAADHVCREFGPGAREGICGHPEIEVALVELGRALEEPAYVRQAQLFVARRGRGLLTPIPLLSPAYFQDDVPVRDAATWSGHAVRALYLAAGAVDVAVETGDDELLAAVRRQWDAVVERRTHLTGGMGSRHQDEGFGDDWELPPDRAYCETCAGVGALMVSWRLFLASGDVRYADLMERVLYNVVAASPRADGRAFFYSNPLQSRTTTEPGASEISGDVENPRAEGAVRAPWFDVSCCPTNLARTLASWQAYSAVVEGDAVSLLQFASGGIDIVLADGARFRADVRTTYPEDGLVVVTVQEAPDRPVELRVRVPHWAGGAVLADPGAAPRRVEPGWAVSRRRFAAGDSVSLTMPMPPRLTWPDPRIDGLRGTAAVERGPLVYCLEGIDLPDGLDVEDLRVDATDPPRLVDGDVVVRARRARVEAPRGLPYAGRRPSPEIGEPFAVRLRPYHRWAERGPTTMRVFLPLTP